MPVLRVFLAFILGNYIRQYPKFRGARDKLKNPC